MCNDANIDWYIRIPTDPPSGDSKVTMQPEICKEEGATLEPAFPIVDNFHIEMGRYVCWNKSNMMHVSQIQNVTD